MSRHDFTATEFAERLARVRNEMAARDLDWLVAIHPASIHWLTGSDAKSYQEFQCLLVGPEGAPLVMLARQGEVHEFETDSLADEVHGFGGGENEDPVAAFARLARRHGLLGGRVGVEVPAYYLHPHHYLALREVLGAALAAEQLADADRAEAFEQFFKAVIVHAAIISSVIGLVIAATKIMLTS